MSQGYSSRMSRKHCHYYEIGRAGKIESWRGVEHFV